jgi:hypothetical protein
MDDAFDWAREGLEKTGAGPEVRALVEFLAGHGEAEGAILARYQRFAEEASAPESRYLVRLILEDERRHHGLLVEMAGAVAWGLVDTGATPVIPDLSHGDAGNQALAEETRRLLDLERSDRVELRRLRRRLRPFTNASLWRLIIDLMVLDTEKHIQILELVARNCREE